MRRTKKAGELSVTDIGDVVTITHRALTVKGYLMGFDPEVAEIKDGAGADTDVLIGPITLEVGDGWGLVVPVRMAAHHTIALEDR